MAYHALIYNCTKLSFGKFWELGIKSSDQRERLTLVMLVAMTSSTIAYFCRRKHVKSSWWPFNSSVSTPSIESFYVILMISELHRTSQAPRLGLVWNIFLWRFWSLLCRRWSRGSRGSHGRGSRGRGSHGRLRWSLRFRFLGEFSQSARSRSYGLRKKNTVWAGGLRCQGRFQELNDLRGSVFPSLVGSFVSHYRSPIDQSWNHVSSVHCVKCSCQKLLLHICHVFGPFSCFNYSLQKIQRIPKISMKN